MKKINILFVSSGNKKHHKISPIVFNQSKSIQKLGHKIDFFAITGKGIWGYLKNLKSLRSVINKGGYDIFHAHYSFSGFLATLAGAKPLVVSLMGSEVAKNKKYYALKLFAKYVWSATIVKSEGMKNKIRASCAEVIPNGVDLSSFKPLSIVECKKHINWDVRRKYILFGSSPLRPEKNFSLAKEAIERLSDQNIILKYMADIPGGLIPYYYNSADVILLTSISEGSPNVIKEAMACNRPIVATDVGDIKWLFGNEEGHYISAFCPEDVASKLRKALAYSTTHQHTNGRNRIKKLGLDDITIASKISNIYTELLT